MTGLRKRRREPIQYISGIGNIADQSQDIKVKGPKLYSKYNIQLPEKQTQHIPKKTLDIMKAAAEKAAKDKAWAD